MNLRRCSSAIAFLITGYSQAAQLNIPTTHPRIWFANSARLQQVRDYHQSVPLTLPNYNASDTASTNYMRALHGVVTNNAQSCALAIRGNPSQPGDTGLMGAVLPTSLGAFRDAIRQSGEAWLAVYDWCHGSMTSNERDTLVARWNGYLVRERDDVTIGTRGEEASNYWSGRVRNFLLWGIASYHDNSQAQAWINEALDTRMGVWFPEWYQAFGKGGVFPEGSDYGVVSLSYPLLAFASAADFGFDPYAQTPYFNEALYALIYGATPGPSTIAGSTLTAYSLFPFGDAMFHSSDVITQRDYVGDFAKYTGVRLQGTGNSKHALAWLRQAQPGTQWIMRALTAPASAPNDLANLPLDYYAPGAGVMAMRTGHDANATAVHLQLGTPNGMSHRHADAGNFQMWRKGRWVTRESAGYSKRILALGQNSGGNFVETDSAVAHNTLLMQGFSTGRWIGNGPWPGQPNNDQPLDFPQVKRLQHESQFAFIATDYSAANRNDGVDTRIDWPATDKAVREFLFLRDLQALIIFDRTRGSSDSQRPFYFTNSWLFNDPRYGQPAFHLNAADVQRHFVMHFETQPTITANRVQASIGTQTNELITLLPSAPNWRVVNEDVPGSELYGQHRLEILQSGTPDAYFLNVLTAYDQGEAAISVNLIDQGTSWSIVLSHPTRGNATVVLQKGMVSTGGSVAINNVVPTPLSETVQGISVTPSGPVWQTSSYFKNGFE